MTYQQIEGYVKSVIAATTGYSRYSIDSNDELAKDLHIDEYDLMDIVFMIENKFSIEISEEDVEHWKTVRDIVDFLYVIFGDNE